MVSRLALSAVVAVAVIVLAGCGGSDPPAGATTSSSPAVGNPEPPLQPTAPPPPAPVPAPAAPTTITIRVVGGTPQGGIARPSVKKGERVMLVVRSDVADEVHLHGYDISRDVAAGGTVRIRFVAKIQGRFEVELENRGITLGEITVE